MARRPRVPVNLPARLSDDLNQVLENEACPYSSRDEFVRHAVFHHIQYIKRTEDPLATARILLDFKNQDPEVAVMRKNVVNMMQRSYTQTLKAFLATMPMDMQVEMLQGLAEMSMLAEAEEAAV